MTNQLLRKSAFSLLLILHLIVTACSPRPTPPPAVAPTDPPETPQATTPLPTSSSNPCLNELLPLKENAAYRYTSSDSPSGSYAFTRRITNVRADGFTIVTEVGGKTIPQDWVCHSEGLTPQQLSVVDMLGLLAFRRFANITLSNISGYALPATLTPNAEWSYAADIQGVEIKPDGTQGGTMTGRLSVTYLAGNRASVTVPAGTFEAVAIEVNTVIDFVITTSTNVADLTADSTYTVWYAPGIGWIKSNGYGQLGGQKYLETIVLESYNIP